MIRGLPLLALVAAASLSSLANAQTGASRVVGQDRPDINPRRAPQTRGPAIKAPAPAQNQAVKAIAPFVVTRVVVEGSSLSAARIEATTRGFIGRAVDGEGVGRIADAVAGAYEGGAIALYTVAVPDQTFADGVLRLTAVEGYIADAVIQGEVGNRDIGLVRRYVAKLTAEKPLTRKTLQRYIQLIRDIPELNPDIQLVNGAVPGEVRLQLTLRPRAARFGVAINNRGTALLGRTQVQADANLYSLLRLGDVTRFTVAFPTQIDRFQYYGFSHTTPLDAEGTTAQATFGYLRTKPDFANLQGHAYSAGFQVSRPVLRNFAEAVYVTLGLDGLNSDNALFGQTFSEDRTRAVRLAVSYGKESATSFFNVSMAGSVGLGHALGARTLDPTLADLDFKKLNVKAIYNTRVGRDFVLRLDAAGQASGDLLPASEQFALGGDEFGRAYEAALISGDRAVAGSAELAFRPQSGLPPMLSGSELYGFVDGGQIWYAARQGYPTNRLSLGSVGGGARVAVAQRAELQVEAAHGLSNPVFFLDRKDTRVIVSLRTIF